MDSVFPKPFDADIQDVAESVAIVVNGDNAPKAISSGQYLFIKNHSTLATGGYHATAAIGSGDAISSSNVAADADGIVNAAYASLNSKFGWETLTCGTPSSGTLVHFDGYKNSALKLVYVNCQVNAASAGATLVINNITVKNNRTVQVYGYNEYNNVITKIAIGSDGTIMLIDGGALIRFTAVFMCE